MGGAVSSGRDNNELIDNLMGGNYIRTRSVERVFRALDRADYMTPEARDQAYKDLAWRNGPLHMSAPCIYSEVMEGLELRPGLSFLNIGSGTGYLSTLVGLIIGSGGISHGIEVHPVVVEYATKKMTQFLENSPTLDEFDFCEPKFYTGNGLCVAPLQAPYDRLYCGAGCPDEYQNYFKQLIKVGGVLVMPLSDNLVQIRRVGEDEWVSRTLLNVSFATLRVPTKDEAADLIKLEEQAPARLQVLARGRIRASMRGGLLRRHPELRAPPPRQPPAKKPCPRRICIPIEDDSDVEGLNALHDLDRASGAHEMNALLSLVLSMGQNRVAGALRFDPLDSPADSSDDDPWPPADEHSDRADEDDAENSSMDSPMDPALEGDAEQERPERARADGQRARRGLVTFEFRDADLPAPAPAPAAPDPAPAAPADPAPAAHDQAPPAPAPPAGGSRPPTPPSPLTPDASPPPADADDAKRKRQHRLDDRRPKSARSKEASDSESESDSESGRGVPAEVEIYLGKAAGQAGCSRMDWDRALSSDDDDDTAADRTKEDKRQKLDSGIGEENSPTSESSPLKSDSKSDESDADGSRRSDSLTDDVDDKPRRKLQKRSRGAGAHSPGSERSGSGSGSWSPGAGARRRCKRRAGGAGGAGAGGAGEARRGGPDARRVRLSVLMKRGVKELPLPHALKKFVNLGRCFEF